MASTVEKLENSIVKINVTIDAEDFSKAIVVAYNKHKGAYPVQGFRKGHAPRAVIERMYGKDVFYEDAVDEVWQPAFLAAIEEHKIDIVSRPSVQTVSAEDGKPLELAFFVAVYPDVELGKYKGIEITKVDASIPEEQVDAMIQAEQQRLVRYVEAERPVQTGDRITFDYKGRVGEEYFAGGEAQGAQLDIGSGQFIPGFEEGMIGFVKDQPGEITVTFPTEYHAPELAGKEAIFEVLVHEIRVPEYPDIDDDLAKDVSEFDTIQEWKASLRAMLEAEAQRSAVVQMQNEALAIIAADSKLELPGAMIEEQMDNMMDNMDGRLQQNGLSLDDYCRYMGMKKEQVRETFREEATTRLRNQLVLDEITKQEGIKATEEEIAARIEELAKGAGKTVEEYKAAMGPNAAEYIGTDIAVDKTLDFLIDNAKLVDKKAEKKPAAKKAPAKKTATKKAADGESAEKKPATKKAPAKKTAAKKADEE